MVAPNFNGASVDNASLTRGVDILSKFAVDIVERRRRQTERHPDKEKRKRKPKKSSSSTT